MSDIKEAQESCKRSFNGIIINNNQCVITEVNIIMGQFLLAKVNSFLSEMNTTSIIKSIFSEAL